MNSEPGTQNQELFDQALTHFPRAIMHVDGDAFFTSVEEAMHPELRGRAVVTGKERNIIACASYEAKRLGIRRGIHLHEARRICPELIVLPDDYESYSLFSKRMFNIIRRYTPMVEESSMDEGFADLTGLRRVFHTSYEDIACQIKEEIKAELDITVSVGLSLSKGLAKLASKFKKPDGFTAVPGDQIENFLRQHTLDDVWGFGDNTSNMLQKMGLRTALDFAQLSENRAGIALGKIGREIWSELRGNAVYPLVTEEKSTYATISKCKTFTAPSSDRDFVYAKLVRNVESAFIKMRRYHLRTALLCVLLRRRDFSQRGLEARLSRATSATPEVLPVVKKLFDQLFEENTEYRTTIILLGKLEDDGVAQRELFEDNVHIEKMEAASRVIDEVAELYGKHKLGVGQSLYLDRHRHTERDEVAARKKNLLSGETARRRLNIPRLFVGV